MCDEIVARQHLFWESLDEPVADMALAQRLRIDMTPLRQTVVPGKIKGQARPHQFFC